MYNYTCSIGYGSIAKIEMKTRKQLILNFLAAFEIKTFEIIEDEKGEYSPIIDIKHTHHSIIKLQHFISSLLLFSAYHGLVLMEDTM